MSDSGKFDESVLSERHHLNTFELGILRAQIMLLLLCTPGLDKYLENRHAIYDAHGKSMWC